MDNFETHFNDLRTRMASENFWNDMYNAYLYKIYQSLGKNFADKILIANLVKEHADAIHYMSTEIMKDIYALDKLDQMYSSIFMETILKLDKKREPLDSFYKTKEYNDIESQIDFQLKNLQSKYSLNTKSALRNSNNIITISNFKTVSSEFKKQLLKISKDSNYEFHGLKDKYKERRNEVFNEFDTEATKQLPQLIKESSKDPIGWLNSVNADDMFKFIGKGFCGAFLWSIASICGKLIPFNNKCNMRNDSMKKIKQMTM